MIGPLNVIEGDLDFPYWQGLAANELRLQRCAGCAAWVWAPQWRCGACGSWDMRWEAVEPAGRVHSWIRTWHPVAAEVAGSRPAVRRRCRTPNRGTDR